MNEAFIGQVFLQFKIEFCKWLKQLKRKENKNKRKQKDWKKEGRRTRRVQDHLACLHAAPPLSPSSSPSPSPPPSPGEPVDRLKITILQQVRSPFHLLSDGKTIIDCPESKYRPFLMTAIYSPQKTRSPLQICLRSAEWSYKSKLSVFRKWKKIDYKITLI